MADKVNTVEEDLAETMLEAEVASVSGDAPVPGPSVPPATPPAVTTGGSGDASGVAGGTDVPGVSDDPPGPVRLSPEKAPSGWTPAMREKWSQLAPEFRQEIIRREEAAANGVAKLREQYQPMESVSKVMNEFGQYFDSIGVTDRAGQVRSVLATERALRSAPTQQRFNMILQLADDYGVPMRHMIGAPNGGLPQGQPQQVQTDPRVMAELNSMREWRENEEQRSIGNQIAMFAANPNAEFFGDVREQMAQLIESGVASSIEDAYSQAVWMNPMTREVLISRQQHGNRNAVVQQRQQAAQEVALGSGHNAAPTLEAETDGSIEDTLRQEWNRSVSGRA